MTTLYFQDHHLLVADRYNELNGAQVVDIAGLFLDGGDMLNATVKALKYISNASKVTFSLLPAEAIDKWLPYAAWVFEANTLTQQVLPTYAHYHGPKSGLSNLILKEFHACEMHYRMHQDGIEASLEKLIAVLYRPHKPEYNFTLDRDGDAREAYNSNTVDYHSKIITSWPLKIKNAILFFYDGCREHLIKSYPTIFVKGDGGDQFTGMFTLMRGLAKDGKFGDFEKVENLYVQTALMELAMMIEENKDDPQ